MAPWLSFLRLLPIFFIALRAVGISSKTQPTEKKKVIVNVKKVTRGDAKNKVQSIPSFLVIGKAPIPVLAARQSGKNAWTLPVPPNAASSSQRLFLTS